MSDNYELKKIFCSGIKQGNGQSYVMKSHNLCCPVDRDRVINLFRRMRLYVGL